MFKYLLKRIGYLIVTMWVVITITFFLMNTLPGNPIEVSFRKLPPQIKKNIMAQYGLDKPIHIRYVKYLKQILKGDLGESVDTPGLRANDAIKERFPASARLGLQSVFVGLVIGLIFGILAAFKRNTWVDYFVIFIAIIGVSVPNFVIAALMQYFLGGIFPTMGWYSKGTSWFAGLKYTILPTIALSFVSIATYARYMRTSVLDVINQDYILTAKSKGVPRIGIIWKHIIRNAILPIVTILGPQIASIITGTFVIEMMFSIPGLGQYYVNSITNRDYMIIMATTIFFAFLYIVSLLVVDILYIFIDPRIRITGGKR
ncbi:MAG: ABC transporter permease [Clostridiales bacterium]|nr:ABC transporter permease [Clostridiales bacterium]HBM79720.1 peptide ABC transporter permease [Clostridiaceae bacterium]